MFALITQKCAKSSANDFMAFTMHYSSVLKTICNHYVFCLYSQPSKCIPRRINECKSIKNEPTNIQSTIYQFSPWCHIVNVYVIYNQFKINFDNIRVSVLHALFKTKTPHEIKKGKVLIYHQCCDILIN